MPDSAQALPHTAGQAVLRPSSTGDWVLRVAGDWLIAHRDSLEQQVTDLAPQLRPDTAVDASALGALDTAGASLLHRLLGPDRVQHLLGAERQLTGPQRGLLQLLQQNWANPADDPLPTTGPTAVPARPGIVQAAWVSVGHVGQTVQRVWQGAVALLGFIGLTLETACKTVPRPKRWRVTSLVANLEQAGARAVPIVVLMNFLIGAVVAFLGATVLADFGASLFTVHLVAFSFLREFGPMLTAIMVAGRTASAFAAQIGSMRANEEVDAIRVMGLNPIELLVLPRVLALLVAVPMLTFLAMLAGLLGGMLVCAATLDISTAQFLSVLTDDVKARHYLIGMAKAPLFAFLIAVIGCLEGFKAQPNAESVGQHTTSAVVQSIFTVICVDAIVALVCMEMKW